MTVSIGVDAGGTKIALGSVDILSGEVLERTELRTDPSRDQTAVLNEVVAEASRLKGAAPTHARIGFGLCELIRPDQEIASHQTFPWTRAEIRNALADVGEVVIESDVRAAALAEARYTPAREASCFLYVILGTGISCAFVRAGVPWLGHRGNAIMLGGNRLERQASGAALEKSVDSTDLARAIDERHPSTASAAEAIGVDLAVAVNALDPELVVIGGGLGRNERFREWVVTRMRTEVFSPETAALPVRVTGLGADGGLIGAACAAAENVS